MSQLIEHTGKIHHIENHHIQVLITQNSACSACHAKSACTAADSTEKIIDVESNDTSFKVGDEVMIFGQRSAGMKAVLLAFVLPFVLILTFLVVFRQFSDNEMLSGILGLAILFPYYLILSSQKDKLKAKLRFYIKHV